MVLDLCAGIFKEDYAAHVLQTFTVLLRGCLDADDTARKAAEYDIAFGLFLLFVFWRHICDTPMKIRSKPFHVSGVEI